MNDKIVESIKSNSAYKELVSKRTSFATKLGIFILVMFYSYILVIAFNPSVLGVKIGEGVLTLGFPVAMAIIIISFLSTLVYVSRANGEFERLTQKIKEDIREQM